MSLKPLEVKTGNIATKAVTSDKIADKAIETRHIKEGAVTPEKLSVVVVSRPVSPPIDSAEIKDGAVKTDEIAGNAVTADKIAPNSVTSEKILDGAVTKEKIRDGAVTKEKMADGIIGTAEIVDGAVTASKLATNSVTKIKLASNSVGYLEIINGSVEPEKIRAINTPAVGNIPVFSTPDQFEWVAPGGVSRPLIPPIDTTEIADSAVGNGQLRNLSVSDEKLIDDAVTTAKIADGAVTKPKLSYKVISITIPALQVGGLYPPLGDPDLNGGVILGYSIPTNQDQMLRQLFLLPGLPQGTGVSILLSAPAIVANTFNVVVLRQ